MSGLAETLTTSGDLRPWSAGVVLSVDHAGARVTVDVDGTAVVLRRIAAAYRPGDVVAVVRDPSRSGAGQYVAGVIGPVAPIWRPGTITAIDTGAKRITVTVDGSSMVLPHLTGTYVVSDVVGVLLDPASEMGGLVLGVIQSAPTAPTSPLTPTSPTTDTSQQFTALIRPTWSGTYRTTRSAWDRWNTGSYGGRSDLYQDGSAESGALTGLACYGDQLVNLGATAFTSVDLTLINNGSGYSGSAAFGVKGSSNGTQPAGAPSTSGSTFTSGSIAKGATSTLTLTDSTLLAGMASGAIKGLALVGATYAGVYGTSRADGMALAVTYTKAV